MANVRKMDEPVKTVVYLDRAAYERVKQEAAALGISMAEWIRSAVAERLRKPRKAVRP